MDDETRLHAILARGAFFPEARELILLMLAAKSRKLAGQAAAVRLGVRASSEDPMQPSQHSLERETAAAVSNVENLRSAGDIAQHGAPQLDIRDSTDVLTEPSPACPGAGDLTLLQAALMPEDACDGMRALAALVLGPCALIAIVIAVALFA